MMKMATWPPKTGKSAQGERVGTLGTLPQKWDPPRLKGFDFIVFIGKVPKSANFPSLGTLPPELAKLAIFHHDSAMPANPPALAVEGQAR